MKPVAVLAPVLVALGLGLPTEQEPAAPSVGRFAMGMELSSFDPLHAQTTDNQVIQRQVLEGLVEYDYYADSYAFRPLLAESWEVGDGGRSWQFRLRPDASFYDPFDPPLWDGRRRPVVARDVVQSWLRLADARNEQSGGWPFLQGLIAGLDELHEATTAGQEAAAASMERAMVDGVPGLRARDDRTLEIRLTRSTPDFLARLASAYCVVYPAEAAQRSAPRFTEAPVGSGPYYLAEFVGHSRAVFRKVPAWRREVDAYGAIPHLDEVQITTVREGSTRSLLFERGEIDRFSPGQDSFARFIDGNRPAGELAERGVRLMLGEHPDISMLAFNMDDPDLGSIPGDAQGNERRRKLRQAVAHAMSYDRWSRLLRNGGRWARSARTFLPPGLPESQGAPSCGARRRDLERARALLDEAGYPGGEGLPELRFELSGSDEIAQDMGELIRDSLAEVGIRVIAIPNSWNEFRAKVNRREAQFFAWGWTLDWLDAANLLQLFYGPNGSPSINRPNFANAEYDRLYEEFRDTQPGAERTAIVHRMLQVLHEELPAIPLDHTKTYRLIQPWLKNVRLNPFDMLPAKYFVVEGRP